MEKRVTDLPFKISDTSILIVRRCQNQGADSAVKRKIAILAAVDRSAELEGADTAA